MPPCSGKVWHARCDSESATIPVTPACSPPKICQMGWATGCRSKASMSASNSPISASRPASPLSRTGSSPEASSDQTCPTGTAPEDGAEAVSSAGFASRGAIGARAAFPLGLTGGLEEGFDKAGTAGATVRKAAASIQTAITADSEPLDLRVGSSALVAVASTFPGAPWSLGSRG